MTLKFDEIIGHPFDTLFTLQNGKLINSGLYYEQKNKLETSIPEELDLEKTEVDPKKEEESKDIELQPDQQDNNDEVQEITPQEILQMKEKDVAGSEITSKLVKGSKTFASKKVFTKEKYIKKKLCKYF